ncbi:MAG TPA: rubrerythrin family protein [Clostridia bacterium]|nr:rubrerythrin family protein [Clostridia bacterium]
MRPMTKQNLEAAFAGESQAHMKYSAFAEEAEKAGKPNVARLFRAISYAEEVHAKNHLRALEGISGTEGNLEKAISGETFEVEEMYPAYDRVAELQDEPSARKTIGYAVEAEKIHAVLYSEALKKVKAGQDADPEPVFVCPVCGYTVKGNPPEKCPVCNASKDVFKKF